MAADGALAQAYGHCRDVAKREARNFYFAFLTLPPAKRHAIYAVYAFARICDDIADGDAPIEAKLTGLAEVTVPLSGLMPALRRAPSSRRWQTWRPPTA